MRLGKQSLKGAEVDTTKDAYKFARTRQLGKKALEFSKKAAQVEGVGLGVDALLMAGGVGNVVKREALASVVDAYMIHKVSHEGEPGHKIPTESKAKKTLHAAKHLAAGAAVAVVAAKGSQELAHVLSPGLEKGVSGAALV